MSSMLVIQTALIVHIAINEVVHNIRKIGILLKSGKIRIPE
jgi:hypothetical protein